MPKRKATRKIRVGVVGARRGLVFARGAQWAGLELAALCDTWEERLREAGAQLGVATYTDYDEFLAHDLDAVILANYCHQHAPLAIKALAAGKHVMSETLACKTLAEGVALARAVEQSGKIYMFAENYAYMRHAQEMRRLYQAGEIGEVQYAEGEYNHPMSADDINRLAPGVNHWRNHIPPTYYPTHAMAPVMYVTDTRPVSVNALSIARSPRDRERLHVRRGDIGAVMLCRLDNGAVARLMGLLMRGHSVWYRFHGTRGLMENLRAGNPEMVRIAHEEWDRRAGDVAEKTYLPEFPVHGELARAAGHGGGDFFTTYHFAQAIRDHVQPYLDVYRALDMSLIAVQAWRSCLADGAPFEIPDLRDESVRASYEHDDWSPFPEDRRPGQPWPSIKGEIKPSKRALTHARRVWAEMGYRGK
ncbi:MAG TPA: Gfo/Idh/MocA family oxidoreductase [Armatimonadota bacterium]|nr:Gfo/Idh/MocA family oxidoreductase [Armatimonadota bacterium]